MTACLPYKWKQNQHTSIWGHLDTQTKEGLDGSATYQPLEHEEFNSRIHLKIYKKKGDGRRRASECQGIFIMFMARALHEGAERGMEPRMTCRNWQERAASTPSCRQVIWGYIWLSSSHVKLLHDPMKSVVQHITRYVTTTIWRHICISWLYLDSLFLIII